MWQAKSHLEILSERLEKAKKFLEENKIYEIDLYNLNAIIVGSAELKNMLSSETQNPNYKVKYYVLLIGFRKLWDEFYNGINTLKEKFI